MFLAAGLTMGLSGSQQEHSESWRLGVMADLKIVSVDGSDSFKQEECPFPIGSVVALRSGGIVMSVTEEYAPYGAWKPWVVKCSWHDDLGNPLNENYPVTVLQDGREEEDPPKKVPRPRDRWKKHAKPQARKLNSGVR